MESWSIATVAAVLVAFGVVSRRLERSLVSPAMFFVAVGALVGNDALGLIDLDAGSEAFRLLAEITLTLLLFSDASRLDLGALRREYAVPARLLGIGLPLTIVLGAILAAGMLGALSFAEALVLAVVLAPTDAALGQAVVSDARLPSRIRQGLNVEGGLNDGICVPILLAVLAVATVDAGSETSSHAIRLLLEEVGYGSLGGAIAGGMGAALIGFASRHHLAEDVWLRLAPTATAALAYGLAVGLGGSGFIAAFVGGLVFGGLRGNDANAPGSFIEESGELFGALTFLLFGAVIAVPALRDLTWQIAVYALLSLTAIRMLPVAIAATGMRESWKTVAFVGWFGPRGLASIVFAAIVVQDAALPHTRTIITVVAVTVLFSVFAHGVSAGPLVERYVRGDLLEKPAAGT